MQTTMEMKLEKRPTTEENPSLKEHNWEKRPTTETKEKPKWEEVNPKGNKKKKKGKKKERKKEINK